jgi:hypothetical protein
MDQDLEEAILVALQLVPSSYANGGQQKESFGRHISQIESDGVCKNRKVSPIYWAGEVYSLVGYTSDVGTPLW